MIMLQFQNFIELVRETHRFLGTMDRFLFFTELVCSSSTGQLGSLLRCMATGKGMLIAEGHLGSAYIYIYTYMYNMYIYIYRWSPPPPRST